MAAFALVMKIAALRRHKETIFTYLWPKNRKIGLRPLRDARKWGRQLTTNEYVGVAVWACLDLWLRCAPFAVPEVRTCVGNYRHLAE